MNRESCLIRRPGVVVATLLVVVSVGGSTAVARFEAPPPSAHSDVPPLATVQVLQLEPVDAAALIARDEAKAARAPGPLQFAEAVDLVVTPATHGTWHVLADGGRLWRLRVWAPGATDLNFGFTRFWLPTGATLHLVSTADGTAEGPYDARDNAAHGELWTPVIGGPEGVVELFVPADASAEPELVLGRVGRGYRDFFSLLGGATKDYGACNVDVVCPDGNAWRDEIRSVAGYGTDGQLFCTGTLIMDVPRSFTPFFLTANHCQVTTANDQSVVVYWHYQAPSCGQQDGGSLSDNQTGAIWRAARADNDMTLLQLEEIPSATAHVYYAGWDAQTSTRPSGSVVIHHPSGHVKSISFNDDALGIGPSCIVGDTAGDTHWVVDNWESGTTEPGSSGSGLWDPDSHLLVGYLSGGSASCTNPAGSDCFGRMAIGWNGASSTVRLRDWLDPDGTGALAVDGADPGGGGGVDTALTSGVPVAGSVAAGEWDYYTIDVPAGATQLAVATSGSSADIDLYLRLGGQPTLAVYDYRPFTASGDETIQVRPSSAPQALVAGTWHVGVNAYETSSYSLVAIVTGGGGGGGSSVHQRWVAIGASTPGENNTFWKTDLGILNRGSGTAHLELSIHTATGVVSGSAEVTAGGQSIFDDLLGQLGQSKGAIQVSSDQPIAVTSRTYNDGGAAGTQGQYLDGVVASDGASAGQSFILMHLVNTAAFRTNLGFQNMGSSTAQLSLTYYNSSGQQVGSAASLSVGSGKVDDRGATFPADTVGYAVVAVSAGAGVQGYASVVDNITGDATTIPMKF